jgi:L-amino acid N-acyltransferase YncA
MNIRLATKEDLPAINTIYNQAVMQKFCTAHLAPVDMEYSRTWFYNHPPDRYPVYVSLEEKKVTGWASLGAYRADRQALIHVGEVSYYVDRESRGRGLGSHLLQHAINVAPAYGLNILVAILLDKNPASITLLKKSGFSQWGSMPGIAIIGEESANHLYFGLKL